MASFAVHESANSGIGLKSLSTPMRRSKTMLMAGQNRLPSYGSIVSDPPKPASFATRKTPAEVEVDADPPQLAKPNPVSATAAMARFRRRGRSDSCAVIRSTVLLNTVPLAQLRKFLGEL